MPLYPSIPMFCSLANYSGDTPKIGRFADS